MPGGGEKLSHNFTKISMLANIEESWTDELWSLCAVLNKMQVLKNDFSSIFNAFPKIY